MTVAEVYDAVWDWLTAVLSDEDRVRRHLDGLRREGPTADDLTTVDRHRAELERQQAKFVTVMSQMESPDGAGPIAAQLGVLAKQLRANGRDREAILPPGSLATRAVSTRGCDRVLSPRGRRYSAGDGTG